ncbi:hypothetical protein PR202_gb04685 [Eleusine coracana subsp. coracana]|uniref:Uncharacterized protein n=1 Tax=Eleusine coracana subsp. coracana TaxID=191504 RepID=A0AAV5E603_ELECO|nr:hypothetical protein PR202_gb04685 [Eleusine coracana subsp. coracana]
MAGAQLERRSSVRRSQSMVLEEDRGSPADEELMFRSQGFQLRLGGRRRGAQDRRRARQGQRRAQVMPH